MSIHSELNGARHDLQERVARTRRKMKDAAHTVRETARERFDEASERGHLMADELRERAGVMGDRAMTAGRQGAMVARRNPVPTAMLVVGGVVGVALLLNSRTRALTLSTLSSMLKGYAAGGVAGALGRGYSSIKGGMAVNQAANAA